MPTTEPSDWWTDYFDADFLRIYRGVVLAEEAGEAAKALVQLCELRPGARVLDVACGWGRHSLELARLGMQVVGVDRSELLLREASAAVSPPGSPGWVRADMRELPFSASFAVAVSLFSSLGYFLSDEEDARVLKAVHTALCPDGLFVLETMHRDGIIREYAERDWWEAEDGELVWVEREFDAVRGVTSETLRWRRTDGSGGEKVHQARIRTATEWDALLRSAGLVPVAWYGGWELGAFDYRSDSLIVVAGRADR